MCPRESSSSLVEDAVHRIFSAINDGIQGWFNGSVPETDEAFGEITRAVHSELSYVFTDGASSVDGAFWLDLRAAWGSNTEIRIATPRRYTRLLLEGEKVVVAEVIELQSGARAVARSRHARRTTLLFLKTREAEDGLLLWRIHESMVPQEEAAGFDWVELDER